MKVNEILQYFLIKKDILSPLNMSHGKISDFVSFPLFWFTLVIKLRTFDSESHRNTLIFFYEKNVRYDYVQSVSDLVYASLGEFWQQVEKYGF